jgi:hypothetical protein
VSALDTPWQRWWQLVQRAGVQPTCEHALTYALYSPLARRWSRTERSCLQPDESHDSARVGPSLRDLLDPHEA